MKLPKEVRLLVYEATFEDKEGLFKKVRENGMLNILATSKTVYAEAFRIAFRKATYVFNGFGFLPIFLEDDKTRPTPTQLLVGDALKARNALDLAMTRGIQGPGLDFGMRQAKFIRHWTICK